MKLSEFKQHLATLGELSLHLPTGELVPRHFHITEVGLTTQQFIDCGGSLRSERCIHLQVWVAQDTDHRLSAEKLGGILKKYEEHFGYEDLDIEVEYETHTLGRYGVEASDKGFLLMPRHADCLAKDVCTTPPKKRIRLSELTMTRGNECSPESGCC